MNNFNLIQNALDSLEHAITHLTNSKTITEGDYKRVILDLSHVAEMLFKERLRKIHPAFVLSDVDKYPSTSAHTVGAAEALQRLKIGGIEFRDEDQSALKNIREKRNEIEHYEFSINANEARILIGNILVFIFRFSLDELELDWSSRRLEDVRWKKLNEFTEFFESQRDAVLVQLEDGQIFTQDCPMCHYDAFDLDSGVCVLCGHREDVLQCKWCKSFYLYSDVEYEDAGLCKKCEYQDGYAAANCEKY